MLSHMAKSKPYVITIVGAESSGKTQLAAQLATHFKCPWIPEYAREHLTSIGRPYNEPDLEVIAKEEIKQLESILRGEWSVVNDESSVVSGELSYESDLIINKIAYHLDSILKEAYKHKRQIVIIDGGMLTLRMWARIKYQVEIPVVEEALKNDVTDLYLLCRPRMDWEPDPLREAPSLLERSWIFNQYLDELSRGDIHTEIVKTD